jgi:hypothetical protein
MQLQRHGTEPGVSCGRDSRGDQCDKALVTRRWGGEAAVMATRCTRRHARRECASCICNLIFVLARCVHVCGKRAGSMHRFAAVWTHDGVTSNDINTRLAPNCHAGICGSDARTAGQCTAVCTKFAACESAKHLRMKMIENPRTAGFEGHVVAEADGGLVAAVTRWEKHVLTRRERVKSCTCPPLAAARSRWGCVSAPQISRHPPKMQCVTDKHCSEAAWLGEGLWGGCSPCFWGLAPRIVGAVGRESSAGQHPWLHALGVATAAGLGGWLVCGVCAWCTVWCCVRVNVKKK